MDPSPDFQKKRGPNPSERRDPQLVAVTPRHILVVTVLVLVPFFRRAIGEFIAYTTLHLGDVLGRARFLCFPVAGIASTASKLPSATYVGLCLSSLWRFSRVSRTELWNAKVSRSFGAYPVQHGPLGLRRLRAQEPNTGCFSHRQHDLHFRLVLQVCSSTRTSRRTTIRSYGCSCQFCPTEDCWVRRVLSEDGLVSCGSCLPLACFCKPTHPLPFGSRGRELLR